MKKENSDYDSLRKAENSMENKYLLSTLVRAKKILDLVQKRKVVTLNEVQKEFNLNSATAFRLLYSLTELDFLVKNGRKYSRY